MQSFKVPQREEVSSANQAIFDKLKGQLGMVPNLYATFAYSENGLSNYLQLQGIKTSLSNKEKEAVNLIVSQVNGCRYCQSAHTVLGKMNGFTEEQILELRSGSASFNPKLDALVKLAKEITASQGRPSDTSLNAFFNAGYNEGSLVDLLIQIADKVIANYLNNITNIPIDFPVAVELELTAA